MSDKAIEPRSDLTADPSVAGPEWASEVVAWYRRAVTPVERALIHNVRHQDCIGGGDIAVADCRAGL